MSNGGFKVGDQVRIQSGDFGDLKGVVVSVDLATQKAKVSIRLAVTEEHEFDFGNLELTS